VVGVQWCTRCANYFRGPAYVFDVPLGFGPLRGYLCTACFRWRRRMMARSGETDLAARRILLAEPQPCIVCGREFAWIGGQMVSSGKLIQRPRPRLHICSDVCARERRNQARRRTGPDQRECEWCGKSFVPSRSDARFCRKAHRQAAYRARQARARRRRSLGVRASRSPKVTTAWGTSARGRTSRAEVPQPRSRHTASADVRAARTGATAGTGCRIEACLKASLIEVAATITEATITCPKCGFKKTEKMASDACQFFYRCEGCGETLRPLEGDCCVFCSYADVACPPKQAD